LSKNPYAPPSSTVSDIESGAPMERPRVVRIAYALCWLSMVVSIPSIVDALVTEGEATGDTQAIYIGFGLIYVAILGFGVYVILSIGRARNWARIVYTVLTALSLVAVLGSLEESFQRPWYSWSADLLTTSMDIAIVALLFRPAANEWYGLRGRKPVEPAV
jgi:hypothetical protein